MSHHHFTPFERGKLEELSKLGYSTRKIALILGRHHSSIARELKRSGANSYKTEQAQQDYQRKRKSSKPQGKWSKELCELVAEKLKVTWSPEQISHTVTAGELSFKTIYNWLYAGRLNGLTAAALRRKGKKRSCRNLAHYARGTPIRKRPKEVYTRETFGHWGSFFSRLQRLFRNLCGAKNTVLHGCTHVQMSSKKSPKHHKREIPQRSSRKNKRAN